MVRSASSRWKGEARNSSQEEPRRYVEFGDRDQSEAAVERWLTSPAGSLSLGRPGAKPRWSSRNSHGGSAAKTSSSPPSETDALTPGPSRATAIKERLRQRTKQEPLKSLESSRIDLLFRKQLDSMTPNSPSARTLSTRTLSTSSGSPMESEVSGTCGEREIDRNITTTDTSPNEGAHVRRSVDTLALEALSSNAYARSSMLQGIPVATRNQVLSTKKSMKVTPLEIPQYPSSPVRRAMVRTSPAGNSVIAVKSSPTKPKHRPGFFGPDKRKSTSFNEIASSSISSPDNKTALGKEKDTSVKKNSSVGPAEQRRQDPPAEEREKPDSRKVQTTGRLIQYDRRQSFNPPAKTNRVKLHVYDLIATETIMQLPWGIQFPIGQCFNTINSGLHNLGTGAYHVGVEINGVEYAYGANEVHGATGVFTCMPRHSPGYQYRTTIDFGDRALIRKVHVSKRGDDINYSSTQERYVDGREVVREMAVEYMGMDYDLLRKNCCTFSHDACLRLGIDEDEIPTWFRNLCVAGALTQDAANSTIEPLSKVFSSCDMEVFSEFVADHGFEVITDGMNNVNEEIVETENSS